MSRKRMAGREHWPTGLREKYVRNTCRYYFIDIEGKYHYLPIGTTLELAIATTQQYNNRFRSFDLDSVLLEQKRKLDKFNKPLDEWLPNVKVVVTKSGIGENALDTFYKDCDRLSNAIGDVYTKSITLEHVNEFLNIVTEGKSDNVYNRKISFLRKVFSHLVDMSAMEENYADRKMMRKTALKKRKRLSQDDFLLMLKSAQAEPKTHWLYIAMSLSLQTTHSALEISRMKYTHVVEQHLRVHRQKVKNLSSSRVEIPISSEMKRIISESKRGIASPYIVHRIGRYARLIAEGCDHPLQVSSKYISRGFSKLRDELGICKEFPKNERPTFHEIRALSIFLYKKRLNIDPMERAAHSSSETTKIYARDHEDWIRVAPAEIKIT